jgi:hypothetical protein
MSRQTLGLLDTYHNKQGQQVSKVSMLQIQDVCSPGMKSREGGCQVLLRC